VITGTRLSALAIATSLSISALAPSCRATHPVPPAPPRVHAVGVEVFSAQGPVAGAHVQLGQGGPLLLGDTNAAGYLELAAIPITANPEWRVWIDATGCAPYSALVQLSSGAQIIRVGSASTQPQDLTLPAITCTPPTPPIPPVAPLSTSGVNFLSNGTIWKYRGATAFTLLQDFAGGKDVTPYLTWVSSLGANTVRVFGTWTVTTFDPRSTPDYYGALDRLGTLLEARGLHLHFVALTDQVPGSSILMSVSERDAHVRQVVEVLRRHPGSLLEIENETEKNGMDAPRYSASTFAGVLTARSSWFDTSLPSVVGSVLDFSTVHTPRTDDWSRKSKTLLDVSRLGWEGFDPSHKPTVGGEPQQAEKATPSDYADYIAVGELYGSGVALHSTAMERDQSPADPSVPAAAAAAWADPPPADLASVGSYTRGGLPDCPIVHIDNETDGNPAGSLRTFCMVAGTRATCVVVRRGPAWRLQPTNGWRVARQYGFHGNSIDLTR